MEGYKRLVTVSWYITGPLHCSNSEIDLFTSSNSIHKYNITYVSKIPKWLVRSYYLLLSQTTLFIINNVIFLLLIIYLTIYWIFPTFQWTFEKGSYFFKPAHSYERQRSSTSCIFTQSFIKVFYQFFQLQSTITP